MTTDNLRTWGHGSFGLAVIHGGPGAAGSMAPVARELAADTGVLEPLQTGKSIDAQVEELRSILAEHCDGPCILVGHSWGAWLAWITAARHPGLVKQLILVGSGPFEARYAENIMDTRLERLDEALRGELRRIMASMDASGGDDGMLARLGELMRRCDGCDLLPGTDDAVKVRMDVHVPVWTQAAALRANGGLLAMAADIRCPVLAIHGDYDPHPADGVRVPLAARLRDFRFELLPDCGHEPWAERRARETFFGLLRREMT